MSEREEVNHQESSFDSLLGSAIDSSRYAVESSEPSAISATVEQWHTLLTHPEVIAAPADLKAAYLVRASDVYFHHFQVLGDRDSLNSAIVARAEAVDILSAEHPAMPHILHKLGICLLTRHEMGGEITDLNDAINVYQNAVKLLPGDSPELPGYLGNLASGLWSRYQITSSLADLDSLILALQRVIDHVPPQSEEPNDSVLGYLGTLAAALWRRYNQGGDITDLDAAIAAYRQATGTASSHHTHYAHNLSGMGDALSERARRAGNDYDLDSAIDAYKRANSDTSPHSPDKLIYLNKLGNGLTARYERSGQQSDLNEAIEVFRQAVGLNMAASPHLASELNNLGNALWRRFHLGGSQEDLDAAIDAYRRASESQHTDRDLHAYSLESLAVNLTERYNITGNNGDLDDLIAAYKGAVEFTSLDSPNLPELLAKLGASFGQRHERAGNLGDLDALIAYSSKAVALNGTQPLRLAKHSTLLGVGLSQRYAQRGRLHDLDMAIEAHRTAINLYPDDSPDLPRSLHILAEDLLHRYNHTGRVSDLDSAAQALERATDLMPNRPDYLASLGNILLAQYEGTADPQQLNRAIDVLGRVEESTAPDWSHRPALLTSKGNALWERYNRDKNAGDLDAVIQAYQDAIDLAGPSDKHFPGYLGNLGTSLFGRYTLTDHLADLDLAIDADQRAANAIEPDSPRRAAFLTNLALVLQERHRLLGRLTDMEGAISAYRQACTEGIDTAASVALTASRAWADWARERQSWLEATEAYRFVLSSMEHLVHIQLVRAQKEQWLMETRGLAAEAAYAAAQIGANDEAVTSLEYGRTLLLGEALDRNSADLRSLELQGQMPLAQRYVHAATKLRDLEVSAAKSDANGPSVDELGVARQKVDEAVKAIRAVAGLSNFLARGTIAHVEDAAASEPLIYLAAAKVGGVGLIVRKGRPVERIWLAALTAESLREIMADYVRAYYVADKEPRTWEGTLNRVTEWLGRNVMGPILDAVHNEQRVVLVPSGWLAVLPLHAAFSSDPNAPSERRYALDDICISYAPSARALRHGQRVATGVDAEAILVVEEPRPTSAPPLPSAQQEALSVSTHFPRSRRLSHEDATREAVLAALPGYTVLHFCCHGYAVPPEPMSGGLILAYDGLLTVRDLMNQSLSGVRLAVLSACETAFPGLKLPDEVIGLPTAFMEAGTAGVVASLWPVYDVTTFVLMARFYDLWRGQGLDPAEALCKAQRWIREATNAEIHDYFPGVPALAAPSHLSAWARTDWEGGHRFAKQHHWAAFTYVGA